MILTAAEPGLRRGGPECDDTRSGPPRFMPPLSFSAAPVLRAVAPRLRGGVSGEGADGE